MVSTTLCKIPTALPVFFSYLYYIYLFTVLLICSLICGSSKSKTFQLPAAPLRRRLPPSSSKKIFSPINFIEISISISYTLINSRFLFLLLLILFQHVRRHLVYIVIQPVRVQRCWTLFLHSAPAWKMDRCLGNSCTVPADLSLFFRSRWYSLFNVMRSYSGCP